MKTFKTYFLERVKEFYAYYDKICAYNLDTVGLAFFFGLADTVLVLWHMITYEEILYPWVYPHWFLVHCLLIVATVHFTFSANESISFWNMMDLNGFYMRSATELLIWGVFFVSGLGSFPVALFCSEFPWVHWIELPLIYGCALYLFFPMGVLVPLWWAVRQRKYVIDAREIARVLNELEARMKSNED